MAEFIGTFALVFTGVGTLAADRLAGGAYGPIGITLVVGLMTAAMITATKPVSGGHLNPAVTAGMVAIGKTKPVEAFGHILAQILGGVVAVAALQSTMPLNIMADINMGAPIPGKNVGIGRVFLMEVGLTFLVVLVFITTVVDERGPKCGGLFVGLVVTAGLLCGGPVSGSGMNPACHVGPALLGGRPELIWLYVSAPMVGGIIAALIYRYGFAE
ncbi:MAG: aquaporin [Verrucomicrobiota bacterium]